VSARAPLGRRDESGASVVEMLVASGITVTTLGVLLGSVIIPLEHLARAHAPDLLAVELATAGEEFARLVRAARPGGTGAAVVAYDEHELVLRLVESGDVVHVRITIVDDALEVERRDPSGATVAGSRRTLVSGLSPGTTRFDVHLADDAIGGEVDGADVVAVGMRLERDGSSIERVVALRMSTRLDGVRGW
jgi:hypothetical protein